MASEMHYPRGPLGPTPQEIFRAAPPISVDARTAFGRAVQREQTQERLKPGYPWDASLDHAAPAEIDGVAIGCALVEYGFLTFTRRSITPPITS